MNQISVMNLRENQILAGDIMEYVVGGYDLPEVVIYGRKHTGDPSDCPHCEGKVPSINEGWNLWKTIQYVTVLWNCREKSNL